MLNIDGTNIYTKTMITCDDDLACQIFVGREELKLRSIGHCAMLEEETMHLGTDADVSAHLLDIKEKKTPMKRLLDTGAVLSVIPIETRKGMGFDKYALIDSRSGKQKCAKGDWQNTHKSNLWMCFLVIENIDESDQSI